MPSINFWSFYFISCVEEEEPQQAVESVEQENCEEEMNEGYSSLPMEDDAKPEGDTKEEEFHETFELPDNYLDIVGMPLLTALPFHSL